MKKIIFAVFVLSLLVSVSAFAEDKDADMSGAPEGSWMGRSMGMPGPGMMGSKGCSMAGKTQMAVTADGSIIVLAGNKLMKYNADLELVKEVEVKMPKGLMGGKQCPMMGKMTGQDADVAAAPQEKTA